MRGKIKRLTMGLTSAVLGTASQKTSILISPKLVRSVTDMAGSQLVCRSAHVFGGNCKSPVLRLYNNVEPYTNRSAA